jgi:hypothetical protein
MLDFLRGVEEDLLETYARCVCRVRCGIDKRSPPDCLESFCGEKKQQSVLIGEIFLFIRREKKFFLRGINNLPTTYKIMPDEAELTSNLR